MISIPTLTPIKQSTDENAHQGKLDYWIKVVIGLCILVVAIDLSLIVFSKKSTDTKKQTSPAAHAVTVSGIFDFNGYIPPDAIVEIESRKIDETAFVIVAGPFKALDTHTWSWDAANDGTSYEMRAVVKSNNTIIATSDSISLTAPALNEDLRIISTLTAPSTPNTTSVISGKIDLNGYIPWGATITIAAKKRGDAQFVPIIQNLKAVDHAAWSWNQAISGTTYELQATLFNNGVIIGISPSLSTASPAKDEVLLINSKAITTPVKETISGVFNINGSLPNGATITLAARKSGTPTFAPIKTGIAPVDKTSWSYPDAQAGVSYDILAYLVVNNNNYAQSQLLVVTAPAQNEVLTMNISSRPGAPPQTSITFNCPGKNNNNQWQVAVQYNQNNVNPNAKAFMLQLGSNSGSSDLFSIQTSPNNPSQMQSYTSNFMLNEGQTYFAQYAYSTCQNCTDPAFYSQFSQPIPVRCVTQPTNTPTPTITNTPSPTISPIPTNTQTPTPTPTPRISQCNESCGGSGYICKDGLQCTTIGGGLGASVCRNPSCPDETNCTCPLPQ